MSYNVTRSSKCSLTSDEEVIQDYKNNPSDWHICSCGTLLEKRNPDNKKDVARIKFEVGDKKMTYHSEFMKELS